MCAKNIFLFFDIFFQSINPILDYTYENCHVNRSNKHVEDLENSGNSDNDNDNDDETNICHCFSCKTIKQISLCFNDKNKSD